MQTSFILSEATSRLPEPYNVLGMPVMLKISGADTNNELSVFSAEYQRRQGPPLHQHPNDETFIITGGEFLFQMGDKRVKAIAGDTIFVPRDMPHAFLTLSEIGKMIFIVNPSGNVEEIFARLSEYKAMPSMEEVIKLHADLGLTILGAPLIPD